MVLILGKSALMLGSHGGRLGHCKTTFGTAGNLQTEPVIYRLLIYHLRTERPL